MNSDYITVSLSVDALEWTKHWLGDLRCDLLLVRLATDPDLLPQVRIIAVESKSTTKEDPLDLSKKTKEFEEAFGQVAATLDALHEVLCPDTDGDLIASLKLSVFVEHLISEVLSQIAPIKPTEFHKTHVLKVLTSLAERRLDCSSQIVLGGAAVVTHVQATVPTVHRPFDIAGRRAHWTIDAVRCGVPELKRLFQEVWSEVSQPGVDGSIVKGLTSGDSIAPEEVKRASVVSSSVVVSEALRQDGDSKTSPESGSTEREDVAAGELTQVENEKDEARQDNVLSEGILELIEQLEATCKVWRFPVEPPDLAFVREGPTLVTVPMVLEMGQLLRPIEARTADIARELGVKSVVVENDPDRAYHIRFLIPKRNRNFPLLPGNSAQHVDPVEGHYLGLLLGQTVDGTPYRSFVSEWPHLLVAGTTNSGKTTFIKSLLVQLSSLGTDACKLVIVDGKGEFDYVGAIDESMYTRKFPELLLGHQHANEVLEWVVDTEIPRRKKALHEFYRANPSADRSTRKALAESAAKCDKFPLEPLIVVIDEFAEIMLAAGADAQAFEDRVLRVVQAGRSSFVHLVLSTQRPSVDVVSGTIKANLPSRIALSLPSAHDSKTILDSGGAEKLLGIGDLLFRLASGTTIRLQGFSLPRGT